VSNAAAGYLHDALFHQSDSDLVACAVPVLRAALDASEAVVLICAELSALKLTAALGGDPRISFADRSTVFRGVAASITACQRIAEQHLAAGARRVQLVAEPRLARGEQAWAEWAAFEAVLSAALKSYPIRGVCIYDRRQLPAEVLSTAERTHPFRLTPTSRQPNPGYLDPARFLLLHQRGPRDPVERSRPVIDVTGADRSVCAVTDHGDGFDDPLAGFFLTRLGERGSGGGLGLWLARHGCDHLTHDREDGIFTVRLVTRHDAEERSDAGERHEAGEQT
jgi:hypothetical protein